MANLIQEASDLATYLYKQSMDYLKNIEIGYGYPDIDTATRYYVLFLKASLRLRRRMYGKGEED